MDFSDLNLKNNPFRLTPPLNPEEIIWVDFNELKLKLEERIKIGISTSPSSIVLNWGSYGIGKTHAALYYSRTSRLADVAKELGCREAKCVKVNLPRTTKDPVQAFLRAFLGHIRFETIKSDFDDLKSIFNDKIQLILDSISNDAIITKIFKKIVEENDPETIILIEDYFYGDSKKGVLERLDLPYGLQDDEQVVNLFSTYINAITYEKKLYSSFFLWIDEFEDIDVLSKSNQERFTTFLRQLIDKTPNNLTIFLNFSPKPFSTKEDLSRTLGDALSTRLRSQIDFKEPSVDQAIDYIDELLNHSFFRKETTTNRFQPFTKDSVEYVLNHINRRTVRIINETFSLLIELALLENVKEINIDFINSKKQELPIWVGDET